MPIVGAQGKPVLLVVKLVICPNEILSILSFVLMGVLHCSQLIRLSRWASMSCALSRRVRLCGDSNVGSHVCNIGNVPNGKILQTLAVVLVCGFLVSAFLICRC